MPGHRSVHGRSHASFGAWSCIGGTGSGLVSGTGFRVFIYRHNRCDSAVQYYLCSKTTGRRKNRDGEWETAEDGENNQQMQRHFYTSAGCRYRYFPCYRRCKNQICRRKNENCGIVLAGL